MSIFIFLIEIPLWAQEETVVGETSGKKHSVSGNYQLNSQNSDGTIPVLNINLSLSPSVIFNDTHEFGGTITYSFSKTESEWGNTKSETSTNVISAFYRYNLMLTSEGAALPIMGYGRSQVGLRWR